MIIDRLKISPQLPEIPLVPAEAVLWAAVGYVAGKINETPPLPWIKIAVIYSLTRDVFYLLGENYFTKDAHKRRFYVGIDSICAGIAIIVLRQLEMIETAGTLFFLGWATWVHLSIWR